MMRMKRCDFIDKKLFSKMHFELWLKYKLLSRDFCNILVNIIRKQLVDQEGQQFQVSHLLWVIRILFRNVIAKQNKCMIVDCMTVISLCPIFQFHRSEVVVCRIANERYTAVFLCKSTTMRNLFIGFKTFSAFQ